MNRPSRPAGAAQHRYEKLAVLGSGGAGRVYLVRDRETGDRVALKRLLGADESSLQRLKREFRSLANIHHPNLIKMYELGQDETSAFFTMEYLEGEDLKANLAAAWTANDNADAEHIERVLRVFEQLAAAVCALHSVGLLHRDLKPSNVLVADGRVVVLDFGIAVDVGEGAATITHEKLMSGTPAYMAPEQVLGDHLGQPNDWYAFGAMLYEALSGVLPIEGSFEELLQQKLDRDPTPIEALMPGLSADVSGLCMALLHRDPAKRPQGDEVLRVLRAHTQSARSQHSAERSDITLIELELSLFGREAELQALWSAFREAQAGACKVVHVFGESGSGKSLLLHEFSDKVAVSGFRADEARPLVLRSRCYERESLPFKALDGAMDALVQELSREPSVVVGHVLSKELLALTLLFPVLKELPVTRQLLQASKLPKGRAQARAQAEAGLHELLQRAAELRPVLLWIDDVQWADLDSIGIISSWLRAPLIPHLMLVFSYRSEELATSPSIRALREAAGAGANIETFLPVRPLGDEHVRALCEQRFEAAKMTGSSQRPMIESIVREAQGSPFLASQLAALAVTLPSPVAHQLTQLSLEELVRSRSQALSPSARHMLNVLAVAGRPIPVSLAVRASSVAGDVRACIHELQTLTLIRTRDSAGDRLLEVYHDRLREVVQSLLTTDERSALEQAVFKALRDAGSTDSDWLHTLALASGERADALRYGLVAAARATQSLAFERAAELYERCVQLSPDASAHDGELYLKLAQAYAYAGHGSRAAAIYLEAASHVSAEQALVFERAASSQLLCSGRFEEGEAVLLRVLDKLDLSAPSTEAGLYAALGWERARAAVRGLSYTPRQPSDVPFLDFFKTELCGMLSVVMAGYDPLRAALFQARCLRMALQLGVSEWVGRALCAAATIASAEGTASSAARADALLSRAEAISDEIDTQLLRTNLVSTRAVCAFLVGDYRKSLEWSPQAEHLLRTASGDNEYHYRFTVASTRIAALMQLGELRSGAAELINYLKEATATENISAELHACVVQAWCDSHADRARSAISRLERQHEQLPRNTFGILHCMHMIAVLHIGCATGEHAWAIEMTRQRWQQYQRSVVKRRDGLAVFAYEAHARLLINSTVRGERAGNLRSAIQLQRTALKNNRCSTAPAFLSCVEARLSLLEGEKSAALQQLTESVRCFERAEASDRAACVRYALGAVTGGDAGAALQQAALTTLCELGVVAPLRYLRGYFPELIEEAAEES